MFIVVVSIITRNWKQPGYPWRKECINCGVHIQYNIDIKTKTKEHDIIKCTDKWMELEENHNEGCISDLEKI